MGITAEAAVINRSLVNFSYKGNSYHDVQPYKLLNHFGVWYLCGVDKKGKLRSFHLKSLSRLNKRGLTFEASTDILQIIENVESVWFPDDPEIRRAVLSIDKTAASYFTRRDILPGQNIEKQHEDGSITLSCEIDDELPFFSRISYWIPYIRIVSPDDLADKFRERIRRYSETL